MYLAYPFAKLLDRIISVRLAEIMFTYEDVLRFAVDKSDQSMLPVSDVVAEPNVEY